MSTAKEKVKNILIWSQKYTRADMLYIAHSGFWMILNQVVSNTLTLILLIAFANLLPAETYGTYTYILSIAAIFNIFTLTGINAAISRSVARGSDDILESAVWYQIKWNIGMLLIFFGFALYYYLKNDTVLSGSFFILGIFVPVTLALNTYGSYLDGKKEFQMVSIFRTLTTVAYVGGMLAAIYFSKEVVVLIAMYAFITFVGTLISYIYVTHKFKQSRHADVSETLQYGKELTFIQFLDPIVAQIDKVILGHFWGPAQLASYALALAIPNKTSALIKSWVNVGFPKFATKTPQAINAVYYRRIVQGIFLGTLITVAYILTAPFIFKYVLPQYIESTYYSQLLSIGFIFALPNRYISLLFSSQKLSQLILKRSIFVSIMNIGLYAFFGILGGILGLIIANLLSGVLSLFLNMALWHKVSKESIHVV